MHRAAWEPAQERMLCLPEDTCVDTAPGFPAGLFQGFPSSSVHVTLSVQGPHNSAARSQRQRVGSEGSRTDPHSSSLPPDDAAGSPVATRPPPGHSFDTSSCAESLYSSTALGQLSVCVRNSPGFERRVFHGAWAPSQLHSLSRHLRPLRKAGLLTYTFQDFSFNSHDSPVI